jgi:hypothetical protein
MVEALEVDLVAELEVAAQVVGKVVFQVVWDMAAAVNQLDILGNLTLLQKTSIKQEPDLWMAPEQGMEMELIHSHKMAQVLELHNNKHYK